MTASAEGASRPAHTVVPAFVTAVVVTHDGARWLPRVLDGLAGQSRQPDQLVVVDTGSRDESYDIAALRLGEEAVVHARRGDGLGVAVAAGLDHADALDPAPGAEQDAWLWLLHDDSAPAPDALAALLDHAGAEPDIGVVGAKLREWPSLRRLLEVGATITGTGHRETGLERGEPDQGQHDRPRDVLAVSSAGMLVRCDVWATLGGFDPHLPVFGADIDFGWRANRAGYRVRVQPAAVVFHAEAATRGLRGDGARPRRAQRQAAVYALLANASTAGLWWQLPRLLVGTLVRVLGLLLAKAPRDAWDELRGALSVYARPWRLVAARRDRRRTARRPAGEIRPLLPSPAQPYRHGAESVLEMARALVRPTDPALRGRRVQGSEPGPVASEAEDLPGGEGLAARITRHPWAAVVVVLVGLALWSGAGLLGSGLLQGGALLPAPDSVGRWWSLYWADWHPVGIGSARAAPPYVLVLALVGTLLAGQAWLVVDLIMLAAVPLCALTAHRLARRLFASPRVRLWWAVTYALVPIVTGAVGQGRLGTVAGAVLLPLVVSAAAALVQRRPGSPAWQQAARLALWLSLLAAFVPLGYPVAVVVITTCAALVLRGWRWLALIAGLLLPAALLAPWLWSRFADPSLWWWEAGFPDSGTEPSARDVTTLLGGVAGGPEQAPPWLGLALVVLAVVSWVRTDRHRELLAAWVVALAGLAVAVAGAGAWVALPTRDAAVPVWVGFPLVLWWGGLACVAGLAADGIGSFLARRPFGWRQPLTAAATAVAVAVPVATIAWWVWDGGTGALERRPATPIPSYLAARATAPVASSTLVLAGSVRDQVTYALVRDDGTRLGEEAVAPTVTERASFDADVAALLTDPSLRAVSDLADHGVGAVYALPPVDPAVSAALDSAPGLQRSGAPDTGARAWQLSDGAGSVRLVPNADSALGDAVAVAADPGLVGPVSLQPDPLGPGSQLLVAAPASPRWSATGPDGDLPVTPADSGVQAFEAPPEAGVVELRYDSSRRRLALGQVALAAVLGLAALPGRRRRA